MNKTIKLCMAVVSALIAAGGGAGCSAPETIEKVNLPVERICVAEFDSGEADREVGPAFARQVASSLRRLTPETQVMVADTDTAVELDPDEALRGGKVSVEALAQTERRHGAEVVILGRITGHDPYVPPSIGVSTLALDPSDGSVLFSGSRLWDGSMNETRREIDRYFRAVARPREKRYGRRIYRLSPRYFRKVAAFSLAREIALALRHSRSIFEW